MFINFFSGLKSFITFEKNKLDNSNLNNQLKITKLNTLINWVSSDSNLTKFRGCVGWKTMLNDSTNGKILQKYALNFFTKN